MHVVASRKIFETRSLLSPAVTRLRQDVQQVVGVGAELIGHAIRAAGRFVLGTRGHVLIRVSEQRGTVARPVELELSPVHHGVFKPR